MGEGNCFAKEKCPALRNKRAALRDMFFHALSGEF
jgi:hypothetical protein